MSWTMVPDKCCPVKFLCEYFYWEPRYRQCDESIPYDIDVKTRPRYYILGCVSGIEAGRLCITTIDIEGIRTTH